MRWLLPFLLFGCASTMTAEEVEYQRQLDRENWALCEAVYKEARQYTLHIGHVHRRGVEPKWYEIKDDLTSNDCRRVLGPYYAK